MSEQPGATASALASAMGAFAGVASDAFSNSNNTGLKGMGKILGPTGAALGALGSIAAEPTYNNGGKVAFGLIGAVALSAAAAPLVAPAIAALGGAAAIVVGTIAFGLIGAVGEFLGEQFWGLMKFLYNTARNSISPIALDLNGDGIDSISVEESSAYFDMDADGIAELTGWVGPEDGILAIDSNGNGRIDDISELFGNESANGFQELSILDSNGDGVIDANDTQFGDLLIWQDEDQNGYTGEGELKSLPDLGISSLDLNAEKINETINGNLISDVSTFTWDDGRTGDLVDIWFEVDQVETISRWDDITLDGRALILPYVRGSGDVPDLQFAMSLDGTLLDMVTVLSFADVSDAHTFHSQIEAVLYRWAGVESVVPGSRGRHVDAQHLAVIEAFMGTDFTQYGGPNPRSRAGSRLEDSWEYIYEEMAVRILVQGPLGQIFPNIAFDQFNHALIADSEIDFVSAITEIAERKPKDALELARYWDIMVMTLDVVARSFTIDTSTFDTELSTAIQNSGVTFTLQDIRDDAVDLQLDSVTKLSGGIGDDTYAFNLGDGVIQIEDIDTGGTGTDTIELGAGIDPADIILIRVGKTSNDMLIRIAGTSDEILVIDQFGNSGRGIEEIEFNDGTVWTSLTIKTKLLESTSGDDELFGFELSDDTLDGGAGEDFLEGRTGNDTYVFDTGYGDDVIFDDDEGGGDDDVVDLATGIAPGDVAISRGGSDDYDLVLTLIASGDTLTILDQFDGSDFGIESVEFDNGTVWNTVDLETMAQQETSGDDRLIGFEVADTLEGGAGNDYIEGRGGDDTLNGESGNDELRGGSGDDTYLFDTGDGSDVILDNGDAADVDKVVFGSGIATGDLFVRRSSVDTDDLIVEVAGTDDKLTVNEFYGSANHQIESFEFDDGTIWTRATIATFVLNNTTGDDQIFGFDGADILDGGLGDDKLQGEEGNDIYIFDSSYGEDTILDSGDAADVDKVEFGSGIAVADVSLTRSSNDPDDLVITFAGSTDKLTINEHYGASKHWIETLEFNDGTVWNRASIDSMVVGSTSGDDNLYGFDTVDNLDGGQGNDYIEGRGGDDTLEGGLGDDELRGGEGNDTYNFDFGDGEDVILDNGNAADVDKVVFGVGIAVADVSLIRSVSDSDDLVITFTGSSDQLVINEHFGSSKHWIETLEFDDGTIWDRASIDNAVLGSSAGDDNLIGFDVAETIEGYAGNDNIESRGGDDVLDGGVGNDKLQGDEGNDTYIFNSGYGEDVILDNGNSFDLDKIILGPGIAPGDLTLSRPTSDRDDVVITFSGSSDKLTINEHYGSQTHWIETIEFDDGTVWTRADIDREVLGSTDGNDNLFGFDTTDILDGGLGNDKLQGEPGDDIYVFDLGYGNDVVLDSGTANDVDTVVFGSGIAPDDLALRRRSADIDDVVIEVVGTSDELQINEFYGNQIHWVELFIFDDGTIWDRTDISELVLVGTDGNDDIFGFDGDDVMDGGFGNDELRGFDGSDTYIFNLGYGSDEIRDQGDASDVDKVVFGAGIDPGDLLVRRRVSDNGDDVVITVIGGTDQLEIQEQYGPNSASYGITNFEFANGTIWDTSDIDTLVITETDGNDNLIAFDGDDTINGGLGNDYIEARGGNDVLDGGLGNDELRGEDGDDIYHFNLGYGSDEIRDEGSASDVDKVVFGAGIDPGDLLVRRRVSDNGDDVVITVIGGTDQLEIQEQYGPNSASYGITNFEFANGTIWDTSDIDTLVITESVGNDNLIAFDVAETINGGLGNDYIEARGGNDVLDGGLGNDELRGENGDDTYHFDIGGGRDVIRDDGNAADVNKLVFGSGVNPDEVLLRLSTSDDDDLIIEFIGNDDDRVIIQEQFGNNANENQMTTFEFNNGVVWNLAFLNELANTPQIVGTSGNDTIDKSSETERHIIYALDGNDTVDGSTGGDDIFGSGGDDTLNGNSGADILVGGADNDTLSGGAGADVLNGQSGTDDLDGGSGADTFIFETGTGDDTVKDFQSGSDLLDVTAFTAFTSGQDVLDSTTDSGGNAVVTLSGSDSITLEGVTKSSLSGSDFITAPASLSSALPISSVDAIRADDLMASLRSDDLKAASHSAKEDAGTDIYFANTDMFVFKTGMGSIDITDFDAGDDSDDLLDLSEAGPMDFSEVLESAAQNGSDAVINLNDDDSLILVGVDKDDLKGGDFQYAA